jgi:branched-chain amino acid transport system ATP-binding protein
VTAAPGLCRCVGVGVHFGGLVALDNVDMEVQHGEIHGLIGPNGAGKSTLLNLLTGIYRPTAGAIMFDDVSLAKLLPHQIAQIGIGRTFQDVQLFARQTVLENVLTGAHAHLRSGLVSSALGLPRQRAEERQVHGDAMDLIRFFGLEDWVGFRAGDLSFGWQRRVSLARAMAARPRLLLLDEPTAGMSQSAAIELARLIQRLRHENVTILLVEHNMPLVMELCDRITVLDHGRRIAMGTPHEVRNDAAVIEAYLGKRGQHAGAA